MVIQVKNNIKKKVGEEYLKKVVEMTRDNTRQQVLHRDALLTREFIRGNQWIYVDNKGLIREIPVDMVYKKDNRRVRPREVVNIMFPIWRTYKSYLVKARPRIVASPEDPEEVYDLLGARVATKIMEYLYETLFLRTKYERLINHQLIYGMAVVHSIWNPETKQCEIVLVPPSQLYVYPHDAITWGDVTQVCWKRSIPTETLEKKYGREFSVDQEEDMMEFNIWDYGMGTEKREKRTTLYDYWKLPTGEDKGCFMRSTKDTILHGIDSFPYKNQDFQGRHRLPFTPIYDNKLDDSIWGFSTMKLLVPRQQSYNRGKSLLATLRQQIPKLLIDTESKIRSRDIVDDDSTIIEYSSFNNAKAPIYTTPAVMNPALINDVTNMPLEIEHTSGFHKVLMRAESMGSIQSGVGIRNLAEQDELRLAPALESLRLGLMGVFEQLYCLVRQYYKTDQIKKILGERGEIDIITFEDIELSPMNFTIEETTFTPQSMAYRQQLMQTLLPLGIFNMNDPKVRKGVYDYIDPALSMKFEASTIEQRLVKVENKRMLEGERVSVNPDDINPIHIEGHNLIIKDMRFRDLSKGVQDNFKVHQEEHRIQEKELQEEKMKLMEATKQEQGMVPSEKPKGGM